MSLEDLQKYIENIDLFNSFPEELRGKLTAIAEIKSFSPNDKILTQGQENRDLYFLLLGQLEILVDGKNVATMDQLGDVIGEMSVITQEPCSATIVASTSKGPYT